MYSPESATTTSAASVLVGNSVILMRMLVMRPCLCRQLMGSQEMPMEALVSSTILRFVGGIEISGTAKKELHPGFEISVQVIVNTVDTGCLA